jgi:hypothetical protein
MIADETAARQVETRRGTVGVALAAGFRLAFAYCIVGVGIELARPRIAPELYERFAAAVYDGPTAFLRTLGLTEPLMRASAEGRVPPWLAAAVVPATGVALVLALFVAIGAAIGFARFVFSLKNR